MLRIPDPSSQRWVQRHFNRVQLLALMVGARVTVGRIARGVGKTQGILAPWLQRRALIMPRSVGGIVAPTYKKFFAEIIPSFYDGMEMLGLQEERHYFVGKRGPAKWSVPFKKVKDWRFSIHWSNGSAQALISQDRPGLGNGLSLDYIAVEEAKLIKSKHFYSSVLPAMRGNRHIFGHLPEWQSMLIISDAGRTAEERWFEAYRQQHDEELVRAIMQAVYEQQRMFQAIREKNLEGSTKKRYLQRINQLEATLVPLRRACVHFLEGDIRDNIDVHSAEKLISEARTMPPDEFLRSYLNITPDILEGAWYHAFDPQRHCYEPQTPDWLMSRGIDRDFLTSARNDCRKDAEIVPSLPLDIAMDYGGYVNCMVVGQQFGDTYRVDKEFMALHPRRTKDCLMDFVRYYQHHKMKEVNYFVDHTALDTHGTSDLNYLEQVEATLRENGWRVNTHYIGKTPDPPLRYELVNKLFQEPSRPVMLNPDNCPNLIVSMRMTRIQEGGRAGFRKYKEGERKKPTAEQIHEPHLGDALDTLLWGRFQHIDAGSTAFAPIFI